MRRGRLLTGCVHVSNTFAAAYYHIERIEVIKGPASATFASVDPGGTINMVTKKPLAVERRK